MPAAPELAIANLFTVGTGDTGSSQPGTEPRQQNLVKQRRVGRAGCVGPGALLLPCGPPSHRCGGCELGWQLSTDVCLLRRLRRGWGGPRACGAIPRPQGREAGSNQVDGCAIDLGQGGGQDTGEESPPTP